MIRIKKTVEEFNALEISMLSINLHDEIDYARVEYNLKNQNKICSGFLYFTKEELATWGEDDRVFISLVMDRLGIEQDANLNLRNTETSIEGTEEEAASIILGSVQSA